MIKNYFKIIVRNLWRNKLYTGINIVGLALGIASMVWGIQTWRYSFSFDEFHHNKDQVFRVLTKMQGNDMLKGICPLPLSNLGKQDFSGIQKAVRWDSRGLDIKAGQNDPFAANVHFTDPDFFDLFNFPLVKGTANIADRSTILLTETSAKKYFGNEDPIGKSLLVYSAEPYKKSLTVTGVLKDPPANSTLQFELLTNMENDLKADGTVIKADDWSWFANAVFVKLANPSDAAKLERAFTKYIPLQQEARKDLKVTAFALKPLETVASMANMIDNNALMERPDDGAAYGPFVLALLVLLSACLNFANTSVAQSNQRLKEMGIRKVMGGTRKQIIVQQLAECSLITLAAIGFSILINRWWLPEFNSMFGFINVTANYLGDYTLIGILAGILVMVTLMAGAYPAFYISRFNASHIFRGSVKFGGRNIFSRVLLAMQISIAFITVIAGLAFARNSGFQKNYDYGYDRDHIIGFHIQSQNEYDALRNELNKIQGVDIIAGTRQHIGFWQRTASLEALQQMKESQYIEAGENYIKTMQLQLVAGRDLDATGSGDIGNAMLINQHLAFEFGWKDKDALGKQIKIDTATCTVVGVLKDFVPGNFFEPMQSFAIGLTKASQYRQLICRAKPGALNKVYDEAKMAWAKLFPLKPFGGYYQSESMADSLRTNNSIAIIFFWFAVISVLLTATGLFALISLTVLKKTKEIAVRRVVGAESKHIFGLILKGYVIIFILGAGLGCYAGYVLSQLLMDLVFRINAGVAMISIWISLACMFAIVAITIISKVWSVLSTKAIAVLKGD